MSQTVQTKFGTGTVVDRENVRGRVSYKVEGPGFSTWIEATAMPLDFQWMPGPDDIQPNSVTLPYNPAPQSWVNPAEQNIQPGQRIDPRKRTAPADSVDFQEDGESYEPGPDPRLFASNWERTRGEPSVALERVFPDGRVGRITRDGMAYSYELEINNSVLKTAFGETYETASQAKEACEEAWEFHNTYNPRESGLTPEDIQAKLGPKYVNAFVEHDFTSLQARLEEHPEIVFSEVRERVGELVAQADQENLERVGRNERLEASDPQLREAAWKDVRAKAVRLRKSGQINTRGATPEVISAQVTGDHGTYEVMVMRSNIFQGNSAVDSWTCECPWGQWAWKREHAFVGRMCSHAYASLMELQALTQSKNPNPKFRNQPTVWASRTAESLETVIDYARDNVYDTLAENGLDIHDPEAYDLIQETWRSSLGMYEDMYGLEIPQDVYERYASRTAADTNLDDLQVLQFLYQFENEGLDPSASGDEQWEWAKSNIDYDTLQDAIDSAHDYGELSASQADALAYDLQQNFFGSRTAEIVDLRPVGWDPYSRNLMNRLRDLTEEGSRPGRQKERNEEIRELVTELRERGFDTNGIIASRKQAVSQTALGGTVTVPDSLVVNAENDLGGGYGVLEGFFSNHPGWYWVAGDENDGVGAGWEAFDEYNVGNVFSGTSSNVQEALDLLDAEIQKVGFMDRPYGYDDIPDYGTTLDYILDHEVQKREDVEEPEFEYPAGGSHGVVNDINDGGGERTSAYEDDYAYGEPPAYDSGDEYGGDENPYYVDPAEQTDWDDPLPDSTTEDDVIANFQRNAGWLMGNDGGGSGNDDIAAAAEAHLRTAGRHFTMAEQQALIDEDDGKPYDRSGLRLDGTHYL